MVRSFLWKFTSRRFGFLPWPCRLFVKMERNLNTNPSNVSRQDIRKDFRKHHRCSFFIVHHQLGRLCFQLWTVNKTLSIDRCESSPSLDLESVIGWSCYSPMNVISLSKTVRTLVWFLPDQIQITRSHFCLGHTLTVEFLS